MTSEAAAPQSTGHSVPQCDAALSQAFALLGKRWNGMILGSLMSGPAGFSEIRRALETISDSVLSDRLSELAGAGLVVREVDEGPPVAVRYRPRRVGSGAGPGAARSHGLGPREPLTGAASSSDSVVVDE